jgi:hypothetical protein
MIKKFCFAHECASTMKWATRMWYEMCFTEQKQPTDMYNPRTQGAKTNSSSFLFQKRTENVKAAFFMAERI